MTEIKNVLKCYTKIKFSILICLLAFTLSEEHVFLQVSDNGNVEACRKGQKKPSSCKKERLTEGWAVVRVHVRQPNVKEQGELVNFHSDRPVLVENPIKNRPIITPGRFNFRAKRLHYTNFPFFRQCLLRDVFILMSHHLKSVNYIDCRWWALYLPLSQTQGQLMKSERDNLRKKLFGLQSSSRYVGTPCAAPTMRQKVVFLTSQCWILRFCDVMWCQPSCCNFYARNIWSPFPANYQIKSGHCTRG